MEEPNQLKVVEQGMLRSRDITRLNFIDFKRTNGYWQNDILGGIQAVSKWLVNTTMYTVTEFDLSMFPERNDWPGWNHVGNHESLGRLYWNFFFWSFEEQSPQLEFSDMPDFTGSFIDDKNIQRTIYGDIGQVSVSTFFIDVLPHLRDHDLWVSVLDQRRQIILEPQIDIARIAHSKLESMFGISKLVEA